MSDVVIRVARADDAAALARLVTQLGYPATAEQMPARFARLSTDENARAFVAENAGVVLGLATIHLRFTMNHQSPIAQLTLLVVDEANRARGVGRALVQAAEQFAQDRGAKRINVTTALNRGNAHAFYERIGYKHTGRRYGRDFD
ncbi:MAG TPA: GNAT family N-acetyltransferase [Gemmatimonadaceae bacterium]